MIYNIRIPQPDDLDAFRLAARRLLAARIEPADVVWTDATGRTLFPDVHSDKKISSLFRVVSFFAGLRFSILTPDLTLHWNRQTATFRA